MRTKLATLATACFLVAATSSACRADDQHHELAKQEQNPLARLVRLQLEDNAQLGFGLDNETLNFLRIQPTIPVDLTNTWSLITRTVIPIAHVPFPSSEDGLSDINVQLLLSPERARRVIWGLGPSIVVPTATDDLLGTGRWSAGPVLALVYRNGPWVAGAIVNQVWSFAGEDNRDDVNTFTLRPLVNYNFPRGWYLTSSPTILANWDVDRDNRWLVPVGGGLGKVSTIAGQEIGAALEAFYHAVSPDIGPDWQLRFQLTFLFPK